MDWSPGKPTVVLRWELCNAGFFEVGDKTSMKIDETPLNHYLIKHLKPLTEADPALLADYVAALLKKSKPKKELQLLCVDQLYDFLGEVLGVGTNSFVNDLFNALDDGGISSSMEDLVGVKSQDNKSSDEIATVGGAVNSRISPPRSERLASTGSQHWEDEVEEEESSDDDRNHKHRRRVSRSRSTDRTDEPNVSRYNGGGTKDLKRQFGDHGRLGQHDREKSSKFERRISRDIGGRYHLADQAERGVLRGGGPPFRGEASNLRLDGGRVGRGRGASNWVGPMPPPFGDAPPLLALTTGFFPNGRSLVGRGTGWSGAFRHMSGMGAASLEHPHIGRGPSGVMNLGMGVGVGPVRPRCLDFEERGFCLRGDLCPMDHGSHIVVEDVQSLSKFNLPVSLPIGRGVVVAPGQRAVSNPTLPTVVPISSRGSRCSREPSIPLLEVPITPNDQGCTEPDLYDPDQPLWDKERPETAGRIRKLSSFQMDSSQVDGDLQKNPELRGTDGSGRGANTSGLHAIDAGSTVWDRIGPVDVSAANSEVKVEEQHTPGRGAPWQSGRWGERESDSEATIISSNPGRGRGAFGWTEAGLSFSRSREGTNLGPRTLSRSLERAQCTLYVSCIPPNSNRAEVLLMHFEKFGRVVDVRIPPHSDRAFVQFATREEAESALASPDAVMRNRFIRLAWANRDSVISDNGASTSFTGQLSTSGFEPTGGHAAQSVQVKRKEPGLNVVVASMSGAPTTDGGSKATTSTDSASSFPTSVSVASKKQEELELMREKIREKQESLAQKRDDFRRKLDQLASQGVSGIDNHAVDHTHKRQKVRNVSDVRLPGKVAAACISPDSFGIKKSSSGEAAQAGVPLVKLKLTRSSRHRTTTGVSAGYPTAPWGPARYKLDNRTTTFRVLPPLPASIADVAAIREHFAVFGELSSVEVEDIESHNADSGQPLNMNNPLRVSYTTRWSAERAMAQGRWFHGQPLNVAWVCISSTSRLPECSAYSNKTALSNLGTKNRADANGIVEELSVVEQRHVGEKANMTFEALQSPARVS